MRNTSARSKRLDIPAAIALQRQLAQRVKFCSLPRRLRIVAGVDVAYSHAAQRSFAVAVAYDIKQQKVLEVAQARRQVEFPYVPGLLSFREAPVMIQAIQHLQHPPDLLLVDGQGIAHPRRCGIASHIGVTLDMPAIGCAKSRLVGKHEAVGEERGQWVDLVHHGQVIGRVVRTKRRVKPVYISVGHRADLDQAVALVLRLATRYRLPDPVHEADRLAGLLKPKG